MIATAIATGAVLGGVLTFASQLAAQLSLPSGPSVPFAVFTGLVGGAVGTIVAAFASIGAFAALVAARRHPIRSWLRASLAGLGAGATGSLPLVYIFARPGWIGAEYATWILSAAVALLATAGIWLCERHQVSAPPG